MRRTLAFLCLLVMTLGWSGCGGNSNTGRASNDADSTEVPTRESNSSIAPTGGPGPEPENAGSVSKNGSANKAETKNGNANKAESNGNKKAP